MLRKTVFVDIDGTITYHHPTVKQAIESRPELLPGVLEAFQHWNSEGTCIILTTARKESARKVTEDMLRELGLWYDQLIMSIGNGERYLINDSTDVEKNPKAFAVNVLRNHGLKGVMDDEDY